MAYKGYKFSEASKLKMRQAKLGKRFTIEHREKLSESHRGAKHPCWKGGTTSARSRFMRSYPYRDWRKAVFERDNYQCVACGARCGNGKRIELNADHIKPYALFPELRLSLQNGRTLCTPCHKEVSAQQNREGLFPRSVATRFKGNPAL